MHQTPGLARPSDASFRGTIAALALGLSVVMAGAAAQAVATPRYVYAPGAQGVTYYTQPQATAAPRQAVAPAAQPASRTVGPGARNWATGNRVPLARPWMRAMN